MGILNANIDILSKRVSLSCIRHPSLSSSGYLHVLRLPHLINRMPKVGISLGYSFEKLFNKAPDLSKLCVFGCLCFPWLRPYSPQKLDPKSNPFVFLGYSLTQSVFLCFDPTLKKTCVRHVKFVEMSSHSHVSLPPPH